MIISLMLEDRYKIGVNSNGKFTINNKNEDIKDVPFVRYRFDEFVESDIDYIKGMMSKFNYSTHLVEISIKDGYYNELRMLREGIPNIAAFVFFPVTNEHVETLELTEKDKSLLGQLKGETVYDRLMIQDCSNTLHTESSNRLKARMEDASGFRAMDIGVCGSPLSRGENSCLTAVRARTLSSIYAERVDCALPSANHESMDKCGCIRYFKVKENIEAPLGKANSRRRTTKENGGNDKKSNKSKKKNRRRRSGKTISAW